MQSKRKSPFGYTARTCDGVFVQRKANPSETRIGALRGICKEFATRSFAANTVEGVACCKKLYFVLGQTLSQAQGDGS